MTLKKTIYFIEVNTFVTCFI